MKYRGLSQEARDYLQEVAKTCEAVEAMEAKASHKYTTSTPCPRREGKGWSLEYSHPTLGYNMNWRKCHCPKGKTEPKPKK